MVWPQNYLEVTLRSVTESAQDRFPIYLWAIKIVTEVPWLLPDVGAEMPNV